MLRHNSQLKVGRSHEYKSDPACVYIGDLKVPKKYITIKLGKSSMDDENKTPLLIRFESICTTTVNDVVFKLALREAEPFTQSFDGEELLLKVNANKSDRIKLLIRWVPLKVIAFSKKIMFEGEVQDSPLPKRLQDLHLTGIDLRTCNDPVLATHYLTMADHIDYNLQIAVSRAIPVVSPKWLDCIAESPHNTEQWLYGVLSTLLLSETINNYVFPNSARPLLLSGCAVTICHDGPLSKQARRLDSWANFLGASTSFLCTDGLDRSVFRSKLSPAPTYILGANEETIRPLLEANQFNTSVDLWSAVVGINIGLLHQFKGSHIQSQDSLQLNQRRKRRKVERVSDTGFFLFSQVPSSLPQARIDEEVDPSLDIAVVEANEIIEEATKESPILEKQASLEVLSRRTSIEEDTKEEEPKSKKAKVEIPKPSLWIVPQVSLADAIRSTKQQATDTVKEELGIGDSVEEALDKMVIVETFDLSIRKSKAADIVVDSAYKGRKNFKSFRKAGPRTTNVTRTFIELETASIGDIHFAEPILPPPARASERVTLDFEKEMDGVKGYQPQSSQLFVDENSDNEDGNDAFSFSTRTATRQELLDISDDENEFAFAFSRK